MQVRLLGQVEVVAGDGDTEPLAVGGPTQRRVLAALALRRNEVVSVPHLVDVIWPDGDPPERAEHNVRTYVHRLRMALDGDGERIETVGSGYRLRLDADELDAARYERLTQLTPRLAETGEVVAALDAAAEAERLWHGAPIEEFQYEPWAVADAIRLREARAEMRTDRAELLIEAGRAGAAIEALESLVGEEPLRERPRALLMRALYESGRQAEALRAFQEFRRLLIDEIGVEPSADLATLDRAIASGTMPTAGEPTRAVGGYELHERIGEGAFAVVHRATQTALDREVAVKIVRAELANRPEFIRRFEAEAQMVARIEHPNVVPLYDYWREPDRAFLVMRWMTGGSLETRLDDGPWTLDATVELVDQIAAALDAAHRAGVVHRDVKPGNILFDDSGRAYLGDFGIALAAEERSRPEAALSEGSPVFASPEQLRREPAGPEADVHALAIVAYTLLTGRTPFADAPDEPTLLQHQLHDPIPPARALRPELPALVDEVLAIATAKQAVDRYPSAPALAAAFKAAASTDETAVAAVGLRPRANPYKGLRAFDETDAADFHGRERLVDEMIDHLAQPDARMLAVVGPSGSGKSSVVRAGVVPALRAGRVPGSSSWFTTAMIPGSRPFEALETALLRVAVNPPAALLDQLRDGDRGILRGVRRIVPDDDAVAAIVIDQFEELFTSTVPDALRDQFLRALTVAVTEPGSPVRVLLTLRADFYDRPLRHPEFAPLLKRHAVAVTPLAPDELEHAIVAPAAAVGVGFEPGLVAEIIADVNHEPGALPLLQYALTQVFDATDNDTITIDAYRGIGGLAGALGRRADELWRTADSEEQHAARRLFGRLVTLGDGSEDTRRRVRISELGDDPSTLAAIERFAGARLLTFDRDPATREPTLEVAHEAIIREWRRLRDWLDDDRDALRIHRHLTIAADGWLAQDRDPGELYRGGRLETATAWATEHRPDLNPVETEFLDASIAAHDAEQAAERARLEQQARNNRRLRVLASIAAVIALIAAAASVFALQQRSRADDEAAVAERNAAEAEANAAQADENAADADAARNDAEQNATLADDRAAEAETERERADENAQAAEQIAFDAETARLAATARDLSTDDPRVAALIALAAYQREQTPETLGALQTVLVNAGPFVAWTGAGNAYTDVELLDGGLVAGIRADGVDLFDRASGALLDAVEVDTHVAASAGALLVVASEAGARLFDVADGELAEVRSFGLPGPLTSVSLTEQTVAATSAGGAVRVWTVGGESLVAIDEAVTSFAAQYPLEARFPLVFRDFWAGLPIRPLIVHHTDEELGFSIGGELVLADLGTGIVKNRSYLFSGFADGALPSPVWHVRERSDGSSFLIGPGWLGVADSLVGLAATTQLTALPDTIGTGLPNVVAGFAVDDEPVTVLEDGVVAWYDADSGERVRTLDLGLGSASSAVLDASARTLTVATSRGLVTVGLDGTGVLRQRLPRLPEQTSLSVSDSGRFVAAGAGGGLAQGVVFELVDDEWTPVDLDLGVGVANQIEFGDEALLNTWTDDGNRVFQLEGVDEPTLLFAPSAAVGGSEGEMPPGQFGLLTTFTPGVGLTTNSLETSELISVIPAPEILGGGEEVTGIRYDPPGDRVLLSVVDGSSVLFDIASGDYDVVDDDIALADWSRSGDLLATVSSAGVITIRDGNSFEPIKRLLGTAGTSNSWNGNNLLFSRDESLLLTNFDGEPRLWDIDIGVQVGVPFPTAPGTNSSISVGDRPHVVTASNDSILVWNLDMETWPDLACRLAGSNLTADEWTQWGPRDMENYPICPDPQP